MVKQGAVFPEIVNQFAGRSSQGAGRSSLTLRTFCEL